MATLETLRKRVLIRLGDYKLTRDLEADHYLNEAQDKFTRETLAVQLVDEIAVVATQSVYTPTPVTGYLIVEVLQVFYYTGTQDRLLAHKTLGEMSVFSENWRNSTGGEPYRYLRNLNSGTEAVSMNSVLVHPTPAAAQVTAGGKLRVVYAAMTDNQLTTDASTTVLPKYDDALVDFALAQMGHPDAQNRMGNFLSKIEELRADVARGFDETPKRVTPNTGR